MSIETSERIVSIGSECAVDWRRGNNNVGIICILNDFIESRSMEELSIHDAESFADAILEVCKDAREHELKPKFDKSK